MNHPSLHWRGDAGVNDHSAGGQKRVKFFHLKSLHVDDITPWFPSEDENDREDCCPPSPNILIDI